MARQKVEGSVPFSNGTEVEWFVSARCSRCVFRYREDDSFCDEAASVWWGEWPDIIVSSDDTPLGVDCSQYEAEG